MDRPDGLSEDALLAHAQGRAAPDDAARIESAAARDPALEAELALMAGLEAALASSTDAPDTRAFGWKRLEAEIRRTPVQVAAPRSPVWQIAAALLAVVAIGQGAYITLSPGSGAAPVYRTVTGESAGFGLGVAFAQTATASEIETLLRAWDGRIVDGPSAIGLYRVVFETEAAREAARSALGASPAVELIAEE